MTRVFSRTNQYALLSLIFFTGSVAVAGLTFYLIDKEGEELKRQMEVIGKDKLMQEQYYSLQEILNQTKSEHTELANYLLTKDNTINFLNEIETMARDMGLKLTTDSLAVSALPNPQFEAIDLRIRVEGERTTLLAFLSVLENLPYFSRINELNLNAVKGSDGAIWSASVSLMVGLHAHGE